MLSLITAYTHIPKSHHPLSPLNCPRVPSLIVEYNPKKWANKKTAILTRYLGFTQVNRAREFEINLDNSWCLWCKRSEEDMELEAGIMDFMEKSEKPTMFPTKEELVKAGRADLVEAIKKRGGWFSFGWHEENVGDNVGDAMDFEIREFQRRVESCKDTASLRARYDDNFSGHEKEDDISPEVNLNSGDLDSVQLTASASMGRSLEFGAREASGIEGILSGLEKQRNSDFGINLDENGYEAHAKSKDEGDDMHFDTSLGLARTDLGEIGRLTHHKGMLNTSIGKINPNIEPETWRTWSSQRAGVQFTEFEAGEIKFSRNEMETDKETGHDEITVTTEEHAKAWDNYSQIRTRLQHLESELTTSLRSLRSKRVECISAEMCSQVTGSSIDLQKLSDAWEFQENEFMSAQERLRSIRAKLAVLEGKMALATVDAQKMVEVKQKQIDDAHKALQLLRDTSIVWPHSASEVLLAGSFDGWTTQRKMEKSRTGIFTVSLKLYPGKYEIKFIVDGIWKIDPIRPIVKNKGYENNLFIVT